MKRVDLAIIGAGPAGMAAAAEAADAGLRVLILDEQRSAGGQVFRNVDAASEVHGKVLGRDFVEGRKLTMGLAHRNITHATGASVWSIEDRVVRFATGEEAQEVRAEHVLLATGALERAMPVPGWTLPGVMTAGAAQIMLKEAAIATRDAVLVGSGPLLYLVAVQLLRAGCPPTALVETQTRGDMRGALTHWRAALRGWRYLQRGAAMLNELRNAGIARYVGAREVTLLGRRRGGAVHFRCGGAVHELASDTVLLHHGVVPNVQAARAVGVPHRWSRRQHAFVPEVDRWGRTAVEGIWIAGDGAGIGGAHVAEQSGRIAGWAIAQALGGITLEERDSRALPMMTKRTIELSIRSFLERAYPPYEAALAPEDEATVCRCEEVSAQEIRAAVAAGCTGPDQLKAFTRAGMGRCQGRFCGLTVTRLMAEERGVSPDEVGYFRVRPPIKPVSLGALATLHDPDDPLEQVVGHD